MTSASYEPAQIHVSDNWNWFFIFTRYPDSSLKMSAGIRREQRGLDRGLPPAIYRADVDPAEDELGRGLEAAGAERQGQGLVQESATGGGGGGLATPSEDRESWERGAHSDHWELENR